MKKQISTHYKTGKDKASQYQKSASTFTQNHPILVFGIIILLLLILIALGSYLRKSPEQETADTTPKQVTVYRVGETPKFVTNAKIEKTGVATVVAQSAGVVNRINLTAGQPVSKGQTIVSLSTTYAGGNTFSIQRQLAQKQNQLVSDTYQDNLDLINYQRQIAENTNTNSEELRKISESSLDSSKSQLDLNKDILNSINSNLEALESATSSAANDQLILSTKQLKGQYESIVSQLDNAIKLTEYQTNTDNPPTKLSELQRETTLKQIDVQEKSLQIQKDISNLQLKLALVTEQLMFPASPFSGIVERVFVRPGQAVSPGTPIAAISGNDQSVTAVVQLPQHVAATINQLENTEFVIADQTISATPYYISRDATAANLYTALYSLPEHLASSLTDNSYLQASLPLGYPDTTLSAGFVPLDAIYQTPSQDLMFIVVNASASAQEISLGQVFGSQVQVQSGLKTGMEIILERNVISGDPVKITN